MCGAEGSESALRCCVTAIVSLSRYPRPCSRRGAKRFQDFQEPRSCFIEGLRGLVDLRSIFFGEFHSSDILGLEL